MKNRKSKSDVEFIDSINDEEDSGDSYEEEAQYDLETSIRESGGVIEFLNTPCIILYKNNLSNQG